MDEFVLFIVFVMIVAGVALGGCIGGRSEMRDAAVKAGAGEYFINEKNNKAFRWKTNQ